MPAVTATVTNTVKFRNATVTSGVPFTYYVSATTYSSTTSSTSTYTFTSATTTTSTITATQASTTRAYDFTLDAPAPTLAPAPAPAASARAIAIADRMMIEESYSAHQLARRGKRVQCSRVTVYVTTRTATAANMTSTVMQSVQPTSTVKATATNYVTATVTPPPVTSTTTVDGGVSTSTIWTYTVNTLSVATRTRTNTEYTATTTVTVPAYKSCAPTAMAPMPTDVYDVANTGTHNQLMYAMPDVDHSGDDRVDCCNSAAAVPGAAGWILHNKMCTGIVIYARNSTELASRCAVGSPKNETVVEYTVSSRGNVGVTGGLLQCGSSMLQD
ncbi:hypothetical protein OC835_005901 [Tilletia horrida]|nr:hypothetical protein OC835_005901 [Tilletia horrida]